MRRPWISRWFRLEGIPGQRTVCGVQLPSGLVQCGKLPVPIFTPATKEEHGHDENISYAQTVARIGAGVATVIREKTLRLYSKAAAHAGARGVIIADTKFEFGQLAMARSFSSMKC